MGKYLLRRGIWWLITLFLFAAAMFILVQIIIPEDFSVQFAMGMTKAERDALKTELGLDLPLWQQFFNWMRDFFTGKLGTSFYGFPVFDLLEKAIPMSLLIFLPGTALAYLIGLSLGKFAGWRGRGIVTDATTLGGLALFTSFPPWLVWLLGYFTGRRVGVFRKVFFDTGGLGNLDRMLWRDFRWTPATVAAFMVISLLAAALLFAAMNRALKRSVKHQIPLFIGIPLIGVAASGSWRLAGFGPQAIDMLRLASLPILTYTLLTFGETLLIMRTSMADTLKEDFVTVARAKGLPERIIRDRHAARNAILPVVTRLIITLPYLLTGVVIIEDVVQWPGVGTALWGSLYQQDMPVVMALFILIGMISLLARLILELLLAVLDPRLRVAQVKFEALSPG